MLPITFEARVKGSGRMSTGRAASGDPTLVMEVASFIFAPSRVPLQQSSLQQQSFCSEVWQEKNETYVSEHVYNKNE